MTPLRSDRPARAILLLACLTAIMLAACGDAVFDDGLVDEAGAETCGDGVCDSGEVGTCPADCSVVDPAGCGAGAIAVGASGGTSTDVVTLRWSALEDGYAILDAPLVLSLPADVTAVTVTFDQPGVEIDLDEVVYGGVVVSSIFEDTALTMLDSQTEAVTLLMPNNERTRLAGGCLTVEASALDAAVGDEVQVTVVSRREAPGDQYDINVVFVGDVEISDDEIDQALDVVDQIYRGAGAPALGEVEFWTMDGASVWPAEGPEIAALRTERFDTPRRLNLFLIGAFDEVGTLGIAAGIPAPPFEGTGSSGLVVAIEEHVNLDGNGIDAQLLGETIAHEMGHMLGLFHTTEAEGREFDPIADTPRCPASADDGDGEYTAEECQSFDGRNLMFWTAAENMSQSQLTPVQVEVMRAHPLAR